MATETIKRPDLRDVVLNIASIDPIVAIDLNCLAEFLLRDNKPDMLAAVASSSRAGSVGIIPVQGALIPRGGRSMYGAYTGMDGLRSQVSSFAADPDISAVVAIFDTPGGTVAGTPETAAAFTAAAAIKPVIAVVDTLAASAGYWLASQCSQIVMSPSSDVGSIGAMILHQDVSGLLDQMGVKMTMIRSSQAPLKNEAHPFAPLSPEATAYLQTRVDEAGTDFIKAVASGRGVSQTKVKEDFGQGRVFGAREAQSRGMIDRVATLDDTISSLMQKANTKGRRRSALAFE